VPCSLRECADPDSLVEELVERTRNGETRRKVREFAVSRLLSLFGSHPKPELKEKIDDDEEFNDEEIQDPG
jgi:hypothetical protein